MAARRADDLRGNLALAFFVQRPEPAPAGRRPRDAGRPGLAGAGEAAALRQLRDGGARRDDRLPDEHEAAAVVIDAPTPSSRAIRTAAITNLGCKVNQSEMEAAARLPPRARDPRSSTATPRRADLVLVNTCTVTLEADAKSRQAVRRARRASPDAEIVVTGCSVQVGPRGVRRRRSRRAARRQPGEGRAARGARALLGPAAARTERRRARRAGAADPVGRRDRGRSPTAAPRSSGRGRS